MGTTLEFSLPPISALAFVPFIYLQAVLLQPSIPNRISRILRILLCIPAIYLAAVGPFRHRIEPVRYAIGANFRASIFHPAFILKALEWGFARDRSTFAWVGFENEDSAPGSNASDLHSEDEKVPPKRRRIRNEANLSALAGSKSIPTINIRGQRNMSEQLPTPPDSPTNSEASDVVEASPIVPLDLGIYGPTADSKSSWTGDKTPMIQVLRDALHLCTSMRGYGYAFAPPKRSMASRPRTPPPSAHGPFARQALWRLFRSHLISTICQILLIHRDDAIPYWLRTYLSIPIAHAKPIAHFLAYLSVGFSLHAQMLIGFEGASLIFLALHYLPRPLQVKFDSREWAPLFDRPFEMSSVTEFWGKQWHALFRKPFTSVGYEPVVAVVNAVAGKKLGKSVGRTLGAVLVFGLSAWMHDFGLWSARYGLSPSPIRKLSFLQRHGANLFFLLQALCIIFEQIYTRTTKRKVAGWWGRIWSLFVIVVLGSLLAGRSWIALGLVDGLPNLDRWGWQRWLLPTVCLAPPPLWVK
ncbi:hypothetical protein MVLG_02029 [Microbotryum lychnidis-dioicae p1A1 Lamole]|uniref:Wax synthase domain-containing protein n=1 Tax=Microbotryum lychnidis-dioicae (strain p1A1 Lamole / MvSl-1064) TaxID=683840 RepID=U5H3X6_USTV1|nr:hypothetical protein MVLG_02029 [Microbotryum lychnidis-dioicae p1A1 Lamole]|eukprot:KDE07759.1 hypothetical protein MVLG_02029 [Microbotryum lychnidis-dioicae p1A1 Lamole]